jgi:hypothetical protein
MKIDRSQIIPILTGIFSLLLGALYLILVQLLDLRGEMVPAPIGGILFHHINIPFLHLPLLPEFMALGYS